MADVQELSYEEIKDTLEKNGYTQGSISVVFGSKSVVFEKHLEHEKLDYPIIVRAIMGSDGTWDGYFNSCDKSYIYSTIDRQEFNNYNIDIKQLINKEVYLFDKLGIRVQFHEQL